MMQSSVFSWTLSLPQLALCGLSTRCLYLLNALCMHCRIKHAFFVKVGSQTTGCACGAYVFLHALLMGVHCVTAEQLVSAPLMLTPQFMDTLRVRLCWSLRAVQAMSNDAFTSG